MRVVHLSTSVSFSSMNIRLQKELVNRGVNSKTLVDDRNPTMKNVVSARGNRLYSAYYIFRSKYEEFILKYLYSNRMDLPFSFGFIGRNVDKEPLLLDSDIIHLHWICNFISIKGIARLVNIKKPIIWTIHDSWPITGGCHVRYGCSQYCYGCTNCHELARKNTYLSESILKKKRKYWANNNIVAVAPSKWMFECLKKSDLFKQENIYHIPNPIDLSIYEYHEKHDDSSIVILFGAVQPTKAKYKGYNYLLEALKIITEKYPDYAKRIELNIFGSDELEENEVLAGFKHNNLGFLNSDEQLVRAYQNSHIYVLPTLDDNLPTTVLESMSCGTPVVSFDIGGLSDMVDHKKNGYLAKYKDSNDFAEGIIWVINNNSENRLSQNARAKIENDFSYSKTVEKYIELYNKVMQG